MLEITLVVGASVTCPRMMVTVALFAPCLNLKMFSPLFQRDVNAEAAARAAVFDLLAIHCELHVRIGRTHNEIIGSGCGDIVRWTRDIQFSRHLQADVRNDFLVIVIFPRRRRG